MKSIAPILLFAILASANNAVHSYAKSQECKACHTEIYKAVLDKHLQNLK
ncbi:hypothetical protein [Sulfurimonas sp.]